MRTVNIPNGYNQLMPYLILNKAEDFLGFVKEVFEGVEGVKHMRDENVVMHAEISIGASVIMVADATDQHGISTAGLFVYVADADATYAKAIEAGAIAVTPISDQPYGRTGGIKDPYGNTWWVTSL